MARPVCVIVGIGEALGAGLARRFGAEGYATALIGRRAAEVERHVEALKAGGVDAHGFPGDASNPATVGRPSPRSATGSAIRGC